MSSIINTGTFRAPVSIAAMTITVEPAKRLTALMSDGIFGYLVTASTAGCISSVGSFPASLR
ncbi:MAG: hypothetical protein IK093_17890 [Ruminiclostridium sp.]|nr:hypothetical protein [Ruminiclostridium sp.]